MTHMHCMIDCTMKAFINILSASCKCVMSLTFKHTFEYMLRRFSQMILCNIAKQNYSRSLQINKLKSNCE